MIHDLRATQGPEGEQPYEKKTAGKTRVEVSKHRTVRTLRGVDGKEGSNMGPPTQRQTGELKKKKKESGGRLH